MTRGMFHVALLILLAMMAVFISCGEDKSTGPVETPALSIDPKTLDFGSEQTSKTFAITNRDTTSVLSWTVSEYHDWITSVNPVSGNTITETDIITVTVSRVNKNPGTYSAVVNVNSDGGNDTVSVIMTVAQIPLTVEMIDIAGGAFQMGDVDSTGYRDERPVHQVTLGDFALSKYEITNAEYCEFLNSDGVTAGGYRGDTLYIDMASAECQIIYTNGQFMPRTGKDAYPVIKVTWFGARAFCARAGGRLPTEAEWEYAAKGGQNGHGYAYSGDSRPSTVAWYSVNSGAASHQGGLKTANELGLYDMSGNVREWCNDWYSDAYYGVSPADDPPGPATGSKRVVRGGSWFDDAPALRTSARASHDPYNNDNKMGFRVCRTR